MPRVSDLLVVLAALAAVAVAAMPVHRDAGDVPGLVLADAHGRLEITNSREGLPVVTGKPVWPGYHVSGRVTVTYQGSNPGALRLLPRRVRGSDEARLARLLHLRVFHVAHSGELVVRYAGRLTRAYQHRLGDDWRPGESRTYAVRVRVSRGGNRYQAERGRFGLLWTATAG